MNGYLNMELLRFTTAGSVDDGKSTLIGRLLYDSKSIFEDQLEAMKVASQRLGNKSVNLALLTDGLRAEREQGITIDVAYRYFATPKRKFIIADTPGHIEYTRNMVTGASTADAAIILVDARNGILEQTKRHSFIASLLRIDHVIVTINKMDLVDFSEEVYNNIRNEYSQIAQRLGIKNVYYIPISALNGDNVVNSSQNTPWYKGPTLLHLLETLPLRSGIDKLPLRLPVQYVIRPQSAQFPDYRAYAGRLVSGRVKVGDPVTILPSFTKSQVTAIDETTESLTEASAPQSIAISLADDVDVSRGCMIVKSGEEPQTGNALPLLVCWLNHRPLRTGTKYIIRHATDEVTGMIRQIDYKVNINTFEHDNNDTAVNMNDIAHVLLKTSKPLNYDCYVKNRDTGSLVIIDPATCETVGAGMIVENGRMDEKIKLADQLCGQFENSSPENLLRHLLELFGNRIALASSLGLEDQVLTHMLTHIDRKARIFTIDTGRLFPEIYDLIDRTNMQYGIKMEVFFPEHSAVEHYVGCNGINAFYESVELRKGCCRARKIEPLMRALSTLDAWICGLRNQQSVTRTGVKLVEWDDVNKLIKVNPLVHWSEEDVWSYIRSNHVPFNTLHSKGYPSIGCQPCTRAVKQGEDIRSGRWWWEDPAHKECGLHKR